ncbi:hypothetical protein EX30DRAFT_337932 [Ascodesmis nigricans]|uniref:Large ribosomal subunit protein uL23m n=1 Tax=Ascodesmis nigricans TaxID=341454 RepID=A0A4S2N8D0_9PEZI|nr:hypothetical protein EX30DRAFT_337932 [Ascodesmis nigricans]
MAAALRPPRIGSKKVFLPNFTVALLRTPHLPPNFAQFEVPLNINKLDLRDYLLHAYNVRVKAVRSFVIQPSLKEASRQAGYRVIKRLPSIKRMTVELENPFVYPAEPEDLSPWDNELYKSIANYREARMEGKNPDLDDKQAEITELAQKILKGETQESITVREVEKEIKVVHEEE